MWASFWTYRRDVHPFETDTREWHSVVVCIYRATNRTWQTKLLDTIYFVRRDRLVGLVVRCPPGERKIPGSNPGWAGIFSGSSHTSDLKMGTAVATLSGAWRYRVSAGTGLPGVSILRLGEVTRLICNFYLSVATRKNCLSRSVPEIH